MNESGIGILGGICEIAHGSGIKEFCEFRIILRLVDVGISGAVHDDVYVVVFDHACHRIGICYVKFGYIGEDVVVVGVLGCVSKAVAQLSVGACYKYVHR